jgi:hypothetical protein
MCNDSSSNYSSSSNKVNVTTIEMVIEIVIEIETEIGIGTEVHHRTSAITINAGTSHYKGRGSGTAIKMISISKIKGGISPIKDRDRDRGDTMHSLSINKDLNTTRDLEKMTHLIEIGSMGETDHRAMTGTKATTGMLTIDYRAMIEIDNKVGTGIKATIDTKVMTGIEVLIDSKAMTTGTCIALLSSISPIGTVEEAGEALRGEDQVALIAVAVINKTPFPGLLTRKWRIS